MRAIGVKQLKARLSEFLRLVKEGETILVTDRDEVIAELRPAHRSDRPLDDAELVLDALASAGEVTLQSLPKVGRAWQVKGLGLAPDTAQRVLDEFGEHR